MMRNPWINSAFARSFDAEILDEAPYEEPLYFSEDPVVRARDGLYLRVHLASGSSWIGKFAYGDPRFPHLSGLVACPSPDCLLVVSCGAATYVTVDPVDCVPVASYPVGQVFACLPLNYIFLADNNRIVAINRSGIAWCAGRVVPDELRIEGVENELIHVTGFDPALQTQIERHVAISSGAVMTPKSQGR